MGDLFSPVCVYPEGKTSISVGVQYAEISVPVRFQPYAILGDPVTECYGDPVVVKHEIMEGERSRGCELMITQTICTHIPIEYGTTVTSGEPCINCSKQPPSQEP